MDRRRRCSSPHRRDFASTHFSGHYHRPALRNRIYWAKEVANKAGYFYVDGRSTYVGGRRLDQVRDDAAPAALTNSGPCSIVGTGLNSGLIRRIWSTQGFHQVSAVIGLRDKAASANIAALGDAGQVYFGLKGSPPNCEGLEGGYIYSQLNNWYSGYMRLDPSFGPTSNGNGYLFTSSGFPCLSSSQYCTNQGQSRTPNALYYSELAATRTAYCNASLTSCSYQQQWFFSSYPGYTPDPTDMLVIEYADGNTSNPLTPIHSFDGLCSQCVALRETNIAQKRSQQMTDGSADEFFGPVDWYRVSLKATGDAPITWNQAVTAGCEIYNGFIDYLNTCQGFSTDKNTIGIAFTDYANESIFISPTYSYAQGSPSEVGFKSEIQSPSSASGPVPFVIATPYRCNQPGQKCLIQTGASTIVNKRL